MTSLTAALDLDVFDARHSCGLCGGEALDLRREIGGFPIVACTECGFMQTGKLLDPSRMTAYYESGYGGLRQRQGQAVNATVNLAILERLNALTTGVKVLDVGCGYGFLLHAISQKYGGTGIGVELAQSELEVARSELGLDVRASLDTVTEAGFDVVCLFEVVEHIAEPVPFIREAAAKVKPGGLLVIGTDNFSSALVEAMGDRFPKWIPHQHISLFDHKTLPLLIAKAGGLELVKSVSFTPWELEVQRSALSLSGGKRGGKVFALDAELKSENQRPYPLFALRKRFNRRWAAATLRNDLSGAMMIVAARKS